MPGKCSQGNMVKNDSAGRLCSQKELRVSNMMHYIKPVRAAIYIYGTPPPPHVPTPVFSISALGRDGFLSCRTAWVNGRKSACKSYVSSSSSSAKLSPRTQIGRIQTYSKRILLNTPRIQDSRFKVPGRTLPCTLNLESWIRGVFNRIRFEYV